MNLQLSRIVLFLLILSKVGYAQTKAIEIKFLGNCGIHMTDGDLNVYVDFPYKSGAYGYMTYDKSVLDSITPNAIFIFTHKHADHYSGKLVRKVRKGEHSKKFTPWRSGKLEKYSQTIPDFDIQALKTKHRFTLKHNSYLITWHGKKIYLSGDTEHANIIGGVKGIDWAFIPYWVLKDAKRNNIKIDATKIVLYHLATPQIPSAKENWGNDPTILLLVNQGQVIRIPYAH